MRRHTKTVNRFFYFCSAYIIEIGLNILLVSECVLFDDRILPTWNKAHLQLFVYVSRITHLSPQYRTRTHSYTQQQQYIQHTAGFWIILDLLRKEKPNEKEITTCIINKNKRHTIVICALLQSQRSRIFFLWI